MKNKNKNKRGNNQFWDTIQDVRQMTNSHMNQKEKGHFAHFEGNIKVYIIIFNIFK